MGSRTPLTPSHPPIPWDAERFRYGWRFVSCKGRNGKPESLQVPLTPEDVLHPQENDVIPERPLQEQERGDLARIFRTRLHRVRGGLVLSDCLIDWGVPGVRNHSPDVSVFADLRRPHNPRRGTLHLAALGGRCLLAIELVSPEPELRRNDVVFKLREYYEAGVPLYIIVDQEREDGPRKLLAFRRTAKGYRRVPLDRRGRLLLRELGLRLGLRDDQVVCYDAATDAELGDYTQVSGALENAEQRLRELEAEVRRLRRRTTGNRPG
jgi:Uma2 family endonuclease